jgi:carboxymethylenebutenolidase
VIETLAHADFVPLADDLRGYYAAPPGSALPALLLFQEAFGINDHIGDVARRFAAAGYATIAPDYYRGKTFAYGGDAEERKKAAFDDGFATRGMRDAVRFLEGRDEVAAERLGAVGFCMGGRLAFLAAETLGERLRGAVGFYGGGIGEARDAGRPALLANVEKIAAPVVLVYGTDDKTIAPEEHARVALALSTAKKRYTLDVYDGAQHGFFCDARPSYHPHHARTAWDRTLRFFGEHLAT